MAQWIFGICGVVVLAGAAWFVFRKHEVSIGHSVLAAVGVLLVVAPHLASFEWSDGTIKFTTRVEGSELAGQAADLATQTAAVREQLTEIVGGLELLEQRVAALESSSSPPIGGTPSAYDFSKFFKANEAAIESLNLKADNLELWSKKLLVAPSTPYPGDVIMSPIAR